MSRKHPPLKPAFNRSSKPHKSFTLLENIRLVVDLIRAKGLSMSAPEVLAELRRLKVVGPGVDWLDVHKEMTAYYGKPNGRD